MTAFFGAVKYPCVERRLIGFVTQCRVHDTSEARRCGMATSRSRHLVITLFDADYIGFVTVRIRTSSIMKNQISSFVYLGFVLFVGRVREPCIAKFLTR